MPIVSVPQSLSRKQYSPRMRLGWQVRPLHARPVAQSLSALQAQPMTRAPARSATQSVRVPAMAPSGDIADQEPRVVIEAVALTVGVQPQPGSAAIPRYTQAPERG